MVGDGSAHTVSGEKNGRKRRTETSLGDSRLDDLFEALADSRRRLVVQYFLRSSADAATVTDLARYVADRTPDEEFETVAVALHHKDVSKLDEADLVEYDDQTETVRYVGSRLVSDLLAHAEGDAESAGTAESATTTPPSSDALEHLSDALAADDPVEKDFRIRQALQYVHFERDE
jgi:hypothetical protein